MAAAGCKLSFGSASGVGPHQDDSQAPSSDAKVGHLGQGPGTGRTQEAVHRDRHKSPLLRSALTLAAELQREHQPTASTVLPPSKWIFEPSLRLN